MLVITGGGFGTTAQCHFIIDKAVRDRRIAAIIGGEIVHGESRLFRSRGLRTESKQTRVFADSQDSHIGRIHITSRTEVAVVEIRIAVVLLIEEDELAVVGFAGHQRFVPEDTGKG